MQNTLKKINTNTSQELSYYGLFVQISKSFIVSSFKTLSDSAYRLFELLLVYTTYDLQFYISSHKIKEIKQIFNKSDSQFKLLLKELKDNNLIITTGKSKNYKILFTDYCKTLLGITNSLDSPKNKPISIDYSPKNKPIINISKIQDETSIKQEKEEGEISVSSINVNNNLNNNNKQSEGVVENLNFCIKSVEKDSKTSNSELTSPNKISDEILKHRIEVLTKWGISENVAKKISKSMNQEIQLESVISYILYTFNKAKKIESKSAFIVYCFFKENIVNLFLEHQNNEKNKEVKKNEINTELENTKKQIQKLKNEFVDKAKQIWHNELNENQKNTIKERIKQKLNIRNEIILFQYFLIDCLKDFGKNENIELIDFIFSSQFENLTFNDCKKFNDLMKMSL